MPEPFQWVEFFAGRAEATRSFRKNHYRSARLDLMYMDGKEGRMNPMDILTPAGMARLARTDRFLVHFDIGNATTVFQTSVACLGFAGCNHRSLKTDVTWFSLGWPYQRSSLGTTRTDGFATSVSNAAPGATSILAQVADQSAAASGTSTMSPSSRAT